MKEQNKLAGRDFSTISPSARSLLLLKGYTNIPFARQAAEMAVYPEKYIPDITNKDIIFLSRILHFEKRYWSIDQLLNELPIKNILELSSGFSFRGLEMVKQDGIHYIDTDLPDMIKTKTGFISYLQKTPPGNNSKLETLPLNALDEEEFNKLAGHFPAGEIVIVNEGLLMYLNMAEKEKLCQIIHRILKQRGGYWITADIYIKKGFSELNLGLDEKTKAFIAQHNIEENKFESFEAAEEFFNKAGFVVDKQAGKDPSKLSSLNYLVENIPEEQLEKMRNIPRVQVSWRLRVK